MQFRATHAMHVTQATKITIKQIMQLELPENVTTYFGPSSSKPTIALNQLQCTMYCTSRAHLYHKQRQNTCGTPRRAVAISLQDGGGGGWVEVVQQYVL